MRIVDMLFRFFWPKLNVSPVCQEKLGREFDHCPSYTRAKEDVRDRVQKQRTRPKRDRKASDACVTRCLAARREELFHRPARAA